MRGIWVAIFGVLLGISMVRAQFGDESIPGGNSNLLTPQPITVNIYDVNLQTSQNTLISTTTYPASTPITISLGTFSSSRLIEVFDGLTASTIPPVYSAGPITVTGTPNGTADSQPTLQFLVARGRSGIFPNFAGNHVEPGLLDFAGVTFSSVALQQRSTAAIAIAGDLTGPVRVGQVFRFQALGRVSNGAVVGGNIGLATQPNTLAIEAIAIDDNDSMLILNATGSNPRIEGSAIQVLTNAGALYGNISVPSRLRSESGARAYYASGIDRLSIGANYTFDGLRGLGTVVDRAPGSSAQMRGSISVPHGMITGLYCFGPIGGGAVSSIVAGRGLSQVLEFAVDSQNVITRGSRGINAPMQIGNEPIEQRDQSDLAASYSVSRIQTRGSITQPITIGGNLSSVRGPSGLSAGIDGIIAQGDITSNITIGGDVYESLICARSMGGTITINGYLTGMIIATSYGNSSAPTINALTIGARIIAPTVGQGDPIVRYTGGFTGTDASFDRFPFDRNLRGPGLLEYLFSITRFFPGDDLVPSIISAQYIGSLSIGTMTREEPREEVELYAPSIEAQRIDSLAIHSLVAGSVWSGNFDAPVVNGVPTSSDDLPTNIVKSDDYATVGTLAIDSIEHEGHIWVQNFSLVDVTGNMTGAIDVPSIPRNATVRIGGALLNDPTSSDLAAVPIDCDHASPRYPGTLDCTNGTAPVYQPFVSRGNIRINNASGLQGEIILRANNNPLTGLGASAWRGDVFVGASNPSTQITLSSLASDPRFLAPSYTLPSAGLGGGSVGVVPFGLHSTDSTPARDGLSSIRPVRNGGAVGTASQVIVTSYGSVSALVETNAPPVRIDYLDPNTLTWTNVTSSFVVTLSPADAGTRASRSIGIRTAANMTPASGRYRVVPTILASSRLNLDNPPLVGWPATSTSDATPAYLFQVACRGDFTLNGTRDVNDIFAFLSAWFARLPSSDYNGNNNGSTADVNDIFAFLAAWFAGCPNQAPPTAAELATSANQIYAIDPETGELYESLSLAPLPILIDSVQSFLVGQPDDARKAAVQAAINDANVTPGMIFTALCASYGTTCELVPTTP